jgi:hypothetical protein
MGRKPETIRLQTLTLEDLEASAERYLAPHLGYLLSLWHGGPWQPRLVTARLRKLLKYAQTGEAHESVDMAVTVASFVTTLYHSALRQPEPSFDLRDPLQLCLAAATCRVLLTQRKPIPVTPLAALAGLSRSGPRHAIKTGELRRVDSWPAGVRECDRPIRHCDAVAFLRKQGVPGVVALSS